MCGIAGIFSRTGRRVAPEAIEFLQGRISHRGPDAKGVWFSSDESVALAHARLSVLDLSPSGAQPMASTDGRFVISYNGEIYNFLEIGAVLKKAGYSSCSSSDTAVILAAFDRWGPEMVHHFNGMWALAIHDTHENTLFLSRDRFGVKPLYYYEDDEVVVFASEAQAIHRLIPHRVRPNREFLGLMAVTGRYVLEPGDSYLDAVNALPGGFNAGFSRNRKELSQWYRLSATEVPAKFVAQVEQLRSLLIDSTEIRMRSDVPVATCLSGGIDSSSIVSLSARATEHPLERSCSSHRTFTAAFPGTELDETAAARLVAEANGMQLDEHIIEYPHPELLETAMRACDGPMPALAFFPIWSLYRHIKSTGISVTLDGQGADEMLGGYYLGYPALRSAFKKWNIPRILDLSRTYSELHVDAPAWIKNDWASLRKAAVSDATRTLKHPLKVALARLSLYDLSRSRADLAWQDVAEQVDPDHPYIGDELAHALFRQFFVNPLPFLLQQYDRASMASGVECRMPFMDYRLVQFVFSLPLESRVGGGFTKRILREAMKGIVPHEILRTRRKTGFNAPFKQWLNGALRSWACDQLDASDALCEGIFDARALRDTLYNRAEPVIERTTWSRIHIAWWLRQSSGFAGNSPSMFA